jgi:hypothetical protein
MVVAMDDPHPRWPDGNPVLIGQRVKVADGEGVWRSDFTVAAVTVWDGAPKQVKVHLDTPEPGPFDADLRCDDKYLLPGPDEVIQVVAGIPNDVPIDIAKAPRGEEFPFTTPDGSDAQMFIQWKNTAVCLDFYCPCGAQGHFDGDFAYYLRCPSCGTVYRLGTQVIVKREDSPSSEPRELEVEHDDNVY